MPMTDTPCTGDLCDVAVAVERERPWPLVAYTLSA
jgi:hypothetical protein